MYIESTYMLKYCIAWFSLKKCYWQIKTAPCVSIPSLPSHQSSLDGEKFALFPALNNFALGKVWLEKITGSAEKVYRDQRDKTEGVRHFSRRTSKGTDELFLAAVVWSTFDAQSDALLESLEFVFTSAHDT